jgi:F-type H+-transporting ATPase subunit gamma
MTHRHKLEHHRHSLNEIRDIMNSMKTLAYMETRKLARFLDAQQSVVHNIENVATDFLSYHPGILPQAAKSKTPKTVYLLVGTERGFCGDFNHALLNQLAKNTPADLPEPPMLIGIGHKLSVLLENNEQVIALFDGASVVEEVTTLIQQIVNKLASLQEQFGILSVNCFYHDADNILQKELLPSFQQLANQPARFSHPPLLNLPPRDFLMELTEHYLFAALHEILYTSLMQENHKRVAHLEGAINHLDEESSQLAQQCNTLRQEEIIEEIEVILLSATNLVEEDALRNKHKK